MQPEWGHGPRVHVTRRQHSGADPTLSRNVRVDAAVHDLPVDLPVRDLTAPDRRRGDFTVVRPDDGQHTGTGRFAFATQVKAALVAADMVATTFAIALATAIASVVTTSIGHASPSGDRLLPTVLLALLIWPVLYAHQGLYQARRIGRRLEEIRRIVNSVLTGVFVLAGTSVLIQGSLSRTWLVLVAVCVSAAMVGEREIARRVIQEFRARGVMTRRVVIVGRNEEAAEVAASLGEQRQLGYEVVGFVADAPIGPVIDLRAGEDLGPYLGHTTEVLQLVRATRASGVIVATTGIDQDSANRLIRDLTREGLYVELTSAMRDISSTRISVRPLGPYPVMCVEPVAQLSWRRVAKRVFDVVAASVGLVLVSPILLAAAIAIRITSGPGVIFSQERVGKNGATFKLFKLRTMVHDAEERLAELRAHNEAAGPMFKMTDDPRVTSVGRFLRASSIDELPQLVNVVIGNMSLVGPRPALPKEADQWDEALWERLRVQPGITGMWQVSGRYTASLETYARLDLYYVDNWSLVTDLAILARTVGVVLHRKGGA